MEEIIQNAKQRMEEVLKLVREDLVNVQTGRAKPALVEGIKVEAYEGTILEIKELASISATDPHSLIIKPWDSTVSENIAKAIQKSNLQLNPILDNDVVRIVIPALTEERRQELVKVVKQKIEAGKAMLRQVRVDFKKDIEAMKDKPGVGEDDIHEKLDELQKITDEYNNKLLETETAKEKELMEI